MTKSQNIVFFGLECLVWDFVLFRKLKCVQLEVANMSNNEMPQQLFAVVPLPNCPHIDQVKSYTSDNLDIKSVCAKCANFGENWLCLQCNEVNCSRFIEGHAVDHSETMGHPIALSFADLSVWCYPCNAYLDNEAFAGVIRAARKSKFGEDGPSSSTQ